MSAEVGRVGGEPWSADPAAVEALLETGSVVRDQRAPAVGGQGAPGLRPASAARRAAIDDLLAEAVAALERQGVNPQAHRGQITATLEAASADEDAGRQVSAGRLSSPLAPPSGFGDLAALSLAVSEEAGELHARRPPDEQVTSRRARKSGSPRPRLSSTGDVRSRRNGGVPSSDATASAAEALRAAHAAADEAEAARKRAEEVRATTGEAQRGRQAAQQAEAVAVAARRDADGLLRASHESGRAPNGLGPRSRRPRSRQPPRAERPRQPNAHSSSRTDPVGTSGSFGFP